MTWKKGQSGNPAGRPSAQIMRHKMDVKQLAQKHTKAAMKALSEIVKDASAPHSARVSAATSLLERGWGKPQQDVNIKGSLEQHVVTMVSALDGIIATSDESREETTH